MNNIKSNYTDKEWEAREQHYIACLGVLVIPQQPEPKEIIMFNARLDYLRTEASLDCAYVQREYEKANNLYKSAEKEAFFVIKKQELEKGNKLTEKEVSGLVTQYLNNTPIGQYNEPITDILNRATGRYIFIKRMIDLLADKQQALFVINGIYKAECTSLKMGVSNIDDPRAIEGGM